MALLFPFCGCQEILRASGGLFVCVFVTCVARGCSYLDVESLFKRWGKWARIPCSSEKEDSHGLIYEKVIF